MILLFFLIPDVSFAAVMLSAPGSSHLNESEDEATHTQLSVSLGEMLNEAEFIVTTGAECVEGTSVLRGVSMESLNSQCCSTQPACSANLSLLSLFDFILFLLLLD